MGMVFMGKSNNEPLMELANTRVELFYQITQFVASRYNSANPLHFNGLAEVVVDEELFCKLVEDFFTSGGERMFYHWAEIATALYEVIKDKRFNWEWSDNEVPWIPFKPFHIGGFVQYLDAKETAIESVGIIPISADE